jgi:hypothetical protein
LSRKGKLLGDNNPAKRPEVKRKIKEAIQAEKNYHWEGGNYDWWHREARKLFEIPVCQGCKITLEEYTSLYKRKKHFDMHCISKDYTILEQWNWKCLCSKCHYKEHKIENENKHWSKDPMLSEVVRGKISEASIGKHGKPKSEETKKKMKEAWQKRKLSKIGESICKI